MTCANASALITAEGNMGSTVASCCARNATVLATVDIVMNGTSHNATARRTLLGTGVEWPSGGNGLLELNSLRFDAMQVPLVSALQPRLLRFAGGALSDTFRWEAGTSAALDGRARSR